MLLFIFKWKLRRKKKQKHSRYMKAFYNNLPIIEQRLRSQRIPRVALQNPNESSWKTLLRSGNDQGLITLTGFDFQTFYWLLQRFRPLYEGNSPFIDPDAGIVPINFPSCGRKRIITAEDCLGLQLTWTCTRGSNMVLQLIFGMSGTSVNMYLRFSRQILVQILLQEPDSHIKVPMEESIRQYQHVIQEKHPALEGVWCAMDGIKLYLQQAGDSTIQNNFYNGWTHDHYVSAVLVFCPDGTIPIACFNVPGSVHDSTIAEWGNIYGKLEKVYNSPVTGKCVVDSAFSKKKTFPY